jgi:hypothetical protein
VPADAGDADGACPALTFRVPPFTAAPGDEVMANLSQLVPPGGDPLLVRRFVLRGTPGLHHTRLTAIRSGRCADVATGTAAVRGLRLLFGSSTGVPEADESLPDGVAVAITPGDTLCLNYHFLNQTDAPVTAEIALDLCAAPPGSEPVRAAMFFFETTDIHIPPRSEAAAEAACAFPRAVSVASFVPHTHGLGRSLDVFRYGGASGGARVKEWAQLRDAAPARFDPPLSLAAGEGFRFRCTWFNDTGAEVGYGGTAAEEMCMIAGFAYPSERGLYGGVSTGDPTACVVAEITE